MNEYQQRCSDCDGNPFAIAYRYCPWCGTQLREEADEDV